MTASQRRGTWPAATVVAHVVLALLTVLTLAGVQHLGAELWQISAAAGAAVLLHVGAVVAHRRPWAGYAIGALGMLVLVTMPSLSWSPSMLPSAVCFPMTLWRLTSRVSVRSSVAALAVAALGVVLTELVAWARLPSDSSGWTRLVEGGLLMLAVGGVWLAALLIRRRREADRRAESERLAAAVADERAGIRRDLHDVIAHTVTVMVARIEAAAVTTADPATRRELGDIAEAGRDAHQGLRAMLATLGPVGAAPRADPRPGQVPISLDALPDLVASAASPLHAVTFAEVGERRPLSLSAEVAAVRTVQEGITNALRHLEPPVEVTVRLRWARAELVVEVCDDGGKALRDVGSPGTGLMGIEERVRTAGGTLSIDDGDEGWVLRTRLPTKEGA
ncbi:Signal transduction histidine kinase [Sinosporangium album]|uniref:histidine kinase n=1 Tax=Sinosporangium album TaxID=504805 RepID=A0A1G8IYS3_9ACTN|nr:histidine kinase [Sinosporangium album]SDI24205.1 Signal transduction histidine kinase [Sinosporangium album]